MQILKPIHYKTSAFWMFTPQKSNTFVKILLTWPGFEPMTSRSEVDHANRYNIEASYKKGQIFHVESYNVLLFWGVKIQNACFL